MRTFAGAAYRWLIAAFVLCVVVQFFLAGIGRLRRRSSAAALRTSRPEELGRRTARSVSSLLLLAILVLLACLAWWSERIWLMGTFLLVVLTFVQFPLARPASTIAGSARCTRRMQG